MKLTFRVLGLVAIFVGLALGVAFGVGYAAGSPRVTSGGISEQQLAKIVGGNAAGGAGGTGVTNTAAGARGSSGGAGAALASRPAGKITAINGNSVTLDTAAGSRTVNVLPRPSPALLASMAPP